MREKEIRHLAYRLKKEKEDSGKGAIVFLGAGASVTGNVPLAKDVIKDILDLYADSPDIDDLKKEEQANYYELMSCLTVKQRKELFKKYIDESKINAAHIYLAKLMEAGYIDYILTVNFDNLILRALALYSLFPATYDIAMLKELTTAKFEAPGVVYLHGRYDGFNLINTEDEFKEVKDLVVDSIKRLEDRPWIVAGYGATDPVFEYIIGLRKFESNLYWISYRDNEPPRNVTNILKDPSFNAFCIKGHDADSFFVKLHTKLEVGEPTFIAHPFSHMKKIHENLVDIKFEEDTTQRFEVTKKWVEDAISTYERQDNIPEAKDDIKIDNIKLELHTAIVKGDYNKLIDIEKKYSTNNDELKDLLSSGYNTWGIALSEKGERTRNEDGNSLLRESIEKYKKAAELNHTRHMVYNNWGVALKELGNRLQKKEGEPLLKESIKKYEKAIEIKQDYKIAYSNLASAIVSLYYKNNNNPKLLDQALKISETAVKYGASKYNLSCVYALKNEKEIAFKILEEVLEKKEMTFTHIAEDKDWEHLRKDERYIQLKEKYSEA